VYVEFQRRIKPDEKMIFRLTQGDSGSSLLCQGSDKEGQILAGVVSWGRGCALNGVPGIYTDITVYRKWLLRSISGSVESASVVTEEEKPSVHIHVLGSKK
jgi:secreted trypsin-like serine protease